MVLPASWYMSPSGNDNNSGTQDDPFLTFSKAVSVVSNGDTIYVAEGVYTGEANERIEPKASITIAALGSPVTINIEPYQVGFIIDRGISLTMIGLNVTTGSTIIDVNEGGKFFAHNCTFGYGQIGILTYGHINVTNCGFLENQNYGIYAEGGVDDPGTVALEDCIFDGNEAGMLCNVMTVTDIRSMYSNGYASGGAGISTNSCRYKGENVTFQNNACRLTEGYGCAISVTAGFTKVSITDIYNGKFYNNTGVYDGGAFFCGDLSQFNMYNTTITHNSATVGGAGECVSTCTLVCQGCIIEDNISTSGNEGSCDFGYESTDSNQ